jgi:hypothetical protein
MTQPKYLLLKGGGGPLFESDNFGLSKPIPGVEQPLWVTSRREFLKQLPESERNILLTGY